MSGEGGGASAERSRCDGVRGAPGPAAPSSPVATLGVGAALSLAFAAQWWAGGAGWEGDAYAAYLLGGLHAPSVREGELFRVVTAPLLHLHAYHFWGTLAGLLVLGATLEAQIGHARWLLVIALSMLAGSAATLAVPPASGVVVGASGALFGMLGAWAALFLRERRAPPPLLRRTRWLVPIAVAVDSAVALLLPGRVGWTAHLGGLAGGMAATAALSRGAGPIPLGGSSRAMRWAAAGLGALFLWGVAVDVERVASGRICRVLERTDLSEGVREGFTAALRDLPVVCSEERTPPLPTPADTGTPARPRTRSRGSHRGP